MASAEEKALVRELNRKEKVHQAWVRDARDTTKTKAERAEIRRAANDLLAEIRAGEARLKELRRAR